jgi:peptide deformylase
MDNGELKMRDLNINTNGESMLSVNGQYLILTRKGHHQVYNLKTNELLCNFPHKDILSLLHCNEIIYFNGVMFINERNIQGRRMYVLYNLS